MRVQTFLMSALCLLSACWQNSGFCSYWQKEETPTKKYLREITLTEEASGMEGIDCIYVINLDRRADKLEKIMQRFGEKGLKLNRVRAVEGGLLSEAQRKELTGKYPIRLKGGVFGCLLSHISIFHDAYHRGFSRVWILEDDALINGDVKKIPGLIEELEKIDPEWDVFYTDLDWRGREGCGRAEAIDPRPDQKVKKLAFFTKRKNVSESIVLLRLRYGTHSYIVSRRGLEKLTNYFSHVFVWSPIDIDMHLVPGIRQYAMREEIVINPQFVNGSDCSAP